MQEMKQYSMHTHHSQLTNFINMNTELTGVIVTFLLTVLLAIPLGKYIAKVFSGEKTFLDFMNPVERFIYRIAVLTPAKSMNWKEFLKAMLTINLLWFVYGFLMLIFQGHLPLNPDGNPDQTPDLAFNTDHQFFSELQPAALFR